jgi:outer membrane immunogenic protein
VIGYLVAKVPVDYDGVNQSQGEVGETLNIKKRFLLGASLAVTARALGLVQVASAGPAVLPNNWTGLYAGIAGGYGWGQSTQKDSGFPTGGTTGAGSGAGGGSGGGSGGTTGAGSGAVGGTTTGGGDGSYSVNGGILGGTLGYDWQQGRWVLGAEGDYSLADISGSSNVCGAAAGIPHSCGTRLESFGTLRGRIGYAIGAAGNWLPYVTGGLAGAELKAWDAFTPASGNVFRAGWTIGGGMETAIARSWTLKLEYLYADFGSHKIFNAAPGVPEMVSFTTNIVRVGFNYKFY